MLSVGQHCVQVDPKISQMTCSFNYSSIKCDCWHWFACCSVVKRVPQCLCLVWIDERSGVMTPLGYTIQLLLPCFSCFLESFDVLYMSPSSASVRILLGPFWFRSAWPLVWQSCYCSSLVILCLRDSTMRKAPVAPNWERNTIYILFVFQVWCMISDTLVKLISTARMITVDAASVVPLSGIG